jgi:hypothetical protein
MTRNAVKIKTRLEQAERLKQLRMSCKFRNATHAAQEINVPVPTYISHENGTRNITPENAAKYAKAYGSTPEWILYGTGPMKTGDIEIFPSEMLGEVDEGQLVTASMALAKRVTGVADKISPVARSMILLALQSVKDSLDGLEKKS